MPDLRNTTLQKLLGDNRSMALLGIALVTKQHGRCLPSNAGGTAKGLLSIVGCDMPVIDIEEPAIIPALHGLSAILGVAECLQMGVLDSNGAEGISKLGFGKTTLTGDRNIADIDQMLYASQ